MHKNLKWGIFILAALALAGSAVRAQGPDTDKPQTQSAPARARTGPRAERGQPGLPSNEVILKKLTERLQLREDQQKKVKDILENKRPEIEKLQAEMQALQGRMKKAMFSAKESIRETLDLDQKEKFDEPTDRLMMRRAQGPLTGPPEMGAKPGLSERGPEGPMIEERGGRPGMPEKEGPDRPEGPPPQEPEDK